MTQLENIETIEKRLWCEQKRCGIQWKLPVDILFLQLPDAAHDETLKELKDARTTFINDNTTYKKALDESRKEAVEQLKNVHYFPQTGALAAGAFP